MSTTKTSRATKAAKDAPHSASETTQDVRKSPVGADLPRTGAEAIEDTRSQIDGAVRRAGRLGREVYLAGLGAMATVDERARVFFSDLVQEGEKVAPKQVPTRLRDAGDRLKQIGGRVESAVGLSVQSGLERAGVPSRREIHQLTSRIEALSAKIDQLGA